MTGESDLTHIPIAELPFSMDIATPIEAYVLALPAPAFQDQLTRIEDKLDQILAKMHGPRKEVP